MIKNESKNTVNFNKGMVLPELILSMIFLVSFGLVITSTSSLLNKLISGYSLIISGLVPIIVNILIIKMSDTQGQLIAVKKLIIN